MATETHGARAASSVKPIKCSLETMNPPTALSAEEMEFSNYVETTFTFTNMGLEAGNQYVFQLVQGVAATGCNIDYADGTAFAINGAKPAEDLVFRLSMCPIILNLAAPTPQPATDENANVEDGSCLFLDCAGTCGGDAYLDPDCGCLDSIDDEGSCIGCIDSEACNFDPTATVGDDSCQFPDCHGDCGGSATLSSCGCIGGNTGIPASACINGCLTEVTASSPNACSPGILYGQSFISTENGLLERIRLKTCCALDAQLVLRRAANLDPCQIGGPQEWNSGEILGYSNLNYSVCAGLGACITSMGVEGYIWRDFDFGGIPIQSGEGYVMELISGVAIANCEGDYADGNAFGGAGALAEKDLVFSIHICNQDQNWGCTDPTSCTFDPQADQNDGSCLYEDCNGECGGDAVESVGCGCIGGSTGIRTEQCVFGTIRPILANDASICPGTLTGQTLTTAADGFLTGLSFYGPSDEMQTLELRRSNGPNAGELVFTTTRNAVPSDCDEEVSNWLQVSLNNFPVQAGSGYRRLWTGMDIGRVPRILSKERESKMDPRSAPPIWPFDWYTGIPLLENWSGGVQRRNSAITIPMPRMMMEAAPLMIATETAAEWPTRLKAVAVWLA